MRFALSVVFAAALTALTPATQAMDPRYKDTNGDMVADAPTSASEFIDPATLVFAYTPVEDPAVYAKIWDGFIDHLAKSTGKKVQFFPVQSNAAQLEAMRAGRLHVAGWRVAKIIYPCLAASMITRFWVSLTRTTQQQPLLIL